MSTIIDTIDKSICLFSDLVKTTLEAAGRVMAAFIGFTVLVVTIVVCCGMAYLAYMNVMKFVTVAEFFTRG